MASGGEKFFLLSVFGFFAGLYFFLKGFGWLKQKRLIENTPTSKIRSIAMGLVEVYGEALSAEGMIFKSPFSNNDCVYYKYTIEEYRQAGKSSHWATVKSGEKQTHFFVKDDTGYVLVDPKGADMEIPMDSQFNSGMGQDPPKIVKAFLENSGMSFEGFLGMNKKMRFREYYIAPGDNLYVMGTAGNNPYTRAMAGGADSIMIQKGKREKIFYISDKPEKEVIKSFGWKAIGGVLGGGAVTIASLFYILSYLRIL